MPACGDDTQGSDDATTLTTSTTSEEGESGESSSESGDGTPVGEWCYGDPGPDPAWAFANLDGTHEVVTPSPCFPDFEAGTTYTLTVDAATRTVTVTTQGQPASFVWDEDEFDAVCENSSFTDGVEVWVMDSLQSGAGVSFSAGGTFEQVQVFLDSPVGCVLRAPSN